MRFCLDFNIIFRVSDKRIDRTDQN
uniref:Uncharacterized protein n=1 Tax=mine drainage metagenome TaxID=410659 RepID=E6QSD9_9ZZZZ